MEIHDIADDLSLLEIVRDFDEMVSTEEDHPPGFEPEEIEGNQIGNFTLLECLGEGGFGSVWKAEQQEPIQREVALKIIKMGMDTREVLTRFQYERQALALMNHPNIAKVLDAGTTTKGRPFFVMELLENGESVTEYCDSKNLNTDERLSLFLQVCSAVQHAHGRGIIHRDLKPSNILVSAACESEDLQLKIIDFGIAKAVGENLLEDASVLTKSNQLIGTPRYMSPEQLAGEGDIDVRTDVYVLGILLYELLTGSSPHPESEGNLRNLQGWARLVSEKTPPKPSTRISKAGSKKGSSIESKLKGDLDCIALKALQPDRNHRYDSVGELSDDLVRFLERRPIEARPQSKSYLLKQFALRHRVVVLFSLAVVFSLFAGLVASTILLVREKNANAIAKRELERSSQISRILTKTLKSAGVSYSLGRDSTMLREILESTAEELDGELAIQPEIEAEIRGIIGRTFDDLDEYPKAVEQLQIAADTLRKQWQNSDRRDPRPLSNTLYDLAEGWQSMGKMEIAEKTLLEVIELNKQAHWESDHARQVVKYRNECLLGWIMMRGGKSLEAEKMMREGYEFWLLHSQEHQLSEIPKTYGTLLGRIGKREEGENVMREELEKFRQLYGPRHPLICNCLSNLGLLLAGSGKFEEAEQMLRESLEQGKALFGDRSPHADHSYSALAGIAMKRGHYEEEISLRRDAVNASESIFPKGHNYRTGALQGLVAALFRQTAPDTDPTNLARIRFAIEQLVELSVTHPEADIDMERLQQLQKTTAKEKIDQ